MQWVAAVPYTKCPQCVALDKEGGWEHAWLWSSIRGTRKIFPLLTWGSVVLALNAADTEEAS